MIEFKTEVEDKSESEPHPNASCTKVTIVYEAASDSEIKVENESIRLTDYKENGGDSQTVQWERYTDSIAINTSNFRNHLCILCNTSFMFKDELLKHLQGIHKRYLCDVDDCDKILTSTSGLNYHKKSRHNASNLIEAYECDFENCDFKHKTAAGLQNHNLRHFPKSHICTVCQKAFYLSHSLKQHLLFHTGEKPYACSDCPKKFSNSGKLRKHKFWHLGVKPFSCKFCQKQLSTWKGKQIHERRHIDGKIGNESIRPPNYNENGGYSLVQLKACTDSTVSNPSNGENHPCIFCNIPFMFKEDLLKHLQEIHKTYFCDVHGCDKILTTSGGLSYHKKSRHNASNLIEAYECNFENCDFKHKTAAGLHYHNIRHFPKSFICDICKKAFYLLSDLKRHLLTHTGEKPYACSDCPKTFSNSGKLRNHKYWHLGVKPYSCNFCGKEFTNNGNRRAHERSHTGERPYACAVCQKTFVSRLSLSNHKKTHSDEKPYKCKVCNTSFKQASHLQQHERTHTGEKPYRCDVCDYAFAQIAHLRTHLKIHTRGKPFSCKTCQSTFGLKSQLTAHEKIHSKDTVFICDLCDKTYLEKRSLRTHLLKCFKENAFKSIQEPTYSSTSDIQQGNIILRITRLRQQ